MMLRVPLRNAGSATRLIELLVVTAIVSGLFCPGTIASCTAGEAGQPAEPRGVEQARSHWAFQPVRRPRVPPVRDPDRVRTPIDAFVLHRLEKAGLSFSPPASQRALIRRARFDLLGLPPRPAETETFIADDAAGAYERLVERFLADPRYGETWGRHWLDLVRFAETAGFNADPDRPLAFKFRDYVIRSFNENKPFDRFVQEQIAGDELFPESVDALVATGYNRMWPDESNASDVLLARQDALNDLTANVGEVFLGLSVGCAQCHNHKFDPILQTDFYELQSFFAGIVLEDRVPVGTAEQLAEYRDRLDHWQKETADVRDELHRIESTARAKAGRVKRLKFPQIVLEAIDTAPESRTAFQHQLVFWSDRQIEVNEKQLLAQMSDAEKKRRDELKKQLAELGKTKPQPPRWADAMATVEVPSGPAKTHLLAGGSYEKPLQEVQPAVPVALRDGPAGTLSFGPPARPGSSGRRAALASWLADPANPLVPRVIVNRIWQEHFGRGLVANANDFGTRTPPPTHPELLDWLASEFVASGWDVKHMHRLIMTSAVYRQSTFRPRPDEPVARAAQVDSENTLYWHFPRRRLSAERIRDSLLAVAGQLNPKMYGPGVKPELPPGFSARHGWKPTKDESERNRRSVYIYAKRNLPYPLLQAFDLPDMHESCARRPATTIAPQALTLLNSELILDAARAFAGRVLSEGPSAELPALVERAYLAAFGRPPERDEIDAAVTFVEQQRALIAANPDSDGKTARPKDFPQSSEPALAAAVVDFCHALLNANEFVYVD